MIRTASRGIIFILESPISCFGKNTTFAVFPITESPSDTDILKLERRFLPVTCERAMIVPVYFLSSTEISTVSQTLSVRARLDSISITTSGSLLVNSTIGVPVATDCQTLVSTLVIVHDTGARTTRLSALRRASSRDISADFREVLSCISVDSLRAFAFS